MKNKLKVLKNKRAFTLIELITTIAILAILVLIAMPRFTGYTQKAEFARIQHDTKIMEQEMSRVILDNEVNLANWDNSPKDLGLLVLKNELFDKEGFVERVDKSHLEKYYNREKLTSNVSSELGVGGAEILLDDEEKEIGDGYKVIPDEYKSNIKTTLSGTFYTNELGKVYYGHDKPLTTQKDSFIKKCDSPVAADLGYTFNYETMTIEGYDHKEEHLVIPESFKNPETDECVPVRIIGKGAFVIGGYKSVVIPESVHTIEDEAFLNNEFTDVYIPHSVDKIGNNAFTGDYISSVTIGRSEGSVNIGDNAFLNRSTGVNIVPNYKAPSAKDLGYMFDVNRGAIVSHSSSNKVLTIPSVVTVNGVEYEVKQIDKGAFQGLGLTAAILPESLERIEDYAFSGNKLVEVAIPESVVHIGNYAFSFNEQTHSLTGEKRATIKSVMMYKGGQLVEQFENINQQGDILENSGGPKVNLFDGRMTLLDHIFVTSIGNHVVDEENIKKEPEEIDMSTGSDIDPSTGQSVNTGACGSTVFKTNDGIVVTSSSSVFCNQDFYNMANLFDGKLSTDDIYYGDTHSYWLAEGRGSQTLTFDFGEQVTISRIDVAPKTRSDTFSNFRIVASNDGTKWDALTDWFITSKSTPASHIESYSMNEKYRYFRIELSTTGIWGASLAEVKFFK